MDNEDLAARYYETLMEHVHRVNARRFHAATRAMEAGESVETLDLARYGVDTAAVVALAVRLRRDPTTNTAAHADEIVTLARELVFGRLR